MLSSYKYRCVDCSAELDTGEINRKPARDALAREGWTTDREPMPPGMLGMFRHHCAECSEQQEAA